MEFLDGINKYIFYYLIFINIVAVILTVYDKWASIHNTKGRIRERNLLLVSVLGGSVSMYIAMLAIRHKTRHSKFMLEIPLIFISQILVIWKVLL